ncbi:MAG: efflux RND transporter permease subunit [Acidobacteriota bacterium]
MAPSSDAEELPSPASSPGDDHKRRPVNPIVLFAVDRKVTMSMMVLGMLVLGWLSLTRLPLEFLPSFSSSSISVNAPFTSASPEEVERLLVRPLEDSLGTINGIDALSATAAAGFGNINIEFEDDVNMDLAAVEVRDRIDRVRDELPPEVERLYVRRFQSTDIPVLWSSVTSPWDKEDLFAFIEDVVQPRLERLEGVAQVSVRGVESKELRIELDPDRLAAHRIELRQLQSVLRTANVNVSGGYLRDGSRRMLVRSVGEFGTLREIAELVIREDGLRLRDVAEVTYDFPRKESYSYLNGSESVYIAINKNSTANLLEVSTRVRAEYDQIQELQEAEGLEVRHFKDSSEDVTKGLSELAISGIFGGGLAVLFMLIFLRKLRTTALIAIAVPLSLVTTFVIIYLARQAGLTDMTLNVMSLMGLMLAVGMLLDNSIVVIESIFRHKQELGADARTAALRGASEVAMPIIASTATTMCVFMPLIFIGGGGFTRFMGDIGLTVCIVMLASLMVSITVVPMVAARLLRNETPSEAGLLDRALSGYGAVVRFTLHHRFVFAVAVCLMLWGSWRLYTGIERTFNPPSEGRQITVFVDAPKRYSVDQRRSLFTETYEILDEGRDQWEIADITHSFQRSGGRSRSRGSRGTNRFEVYLTPEEESVKAVGDIRNSIREALPVRAGVTYKIAQAQGGPPGSGSSGLNVELIGEDLEILSLLSPGIVDALSGLPFLRDVDTSLESGDDEIRVGVNRERALQAGLSSQMVAQTVNGALSSRNLSYFKTEDREVGIVMQYREEDRATLDQLKTLPVSMTGRTPLSIGALADFELGDGAKTIERENRRAKIDITANTVGDMPSFALRRPVESVVRRLGLPEGYELDFGRSFRDAQNEAAGALFALAFAMLLIYMIMTSLFENFVQPFTILLSIPFAFVGVGLVMKLLGQARSSAADMGLVILAGIVVNNAIVLIDHINHLRQQGMSREEAIVLGGTHRVRPILMTAITTILGLSPMVAPFVLPEVFGQPEGRAAYWAPVGLVILGGLTTSTFLTLLVTPTLYSIMDDLTRGVRRVLARA